MSDLILNQPPFSLLPLSLYTAAQVRELDRMAIDDHGIPGASLMARAGQAAFEVLQRRWPRCRSLGVLCGVGNNGGDGFIVARLAHEAGYSVRVWQVGDVAKIRGDALNARQQMQAAGLGVEPFTGNDFGDADADAYAEVLVDSLLGTGLNGEVEGDWRQAIEAINTAHDNGVNILALDIPSGLQADTGRILGDAVHADACISFIGLKAGMMTGQGPALCGALSFSDLEVPEPVYARMKAVARRIDWSQMSLPARNQSAHKGDFGHVLIVGGDHGMAGEAALRTGAGLVSVATRAEHAASISAARPEIMSLGIETDSASFSVLARLLKRATVLAVGPGLGQGIWGRKLFSALMESTLPMVVDADALNLLAAEPVKRDNWILTPHPGEAARLLDQTIAQVETDRIAAALAIQQKYGGVVVLKGAGTIVVNSSGDIAICSEGNPGMASGGMGDVLTGVIASLLAQSAQGSLHSSVALFMAAQQGVSLQAHAADIAAQDGQRGLLASDLFPVMRRLLG
ncbi:MAG: NAD(P)H-hydrate dehydratase [Ectothiorhodospiraceae bacterium]|nr:NAD(P)H-hydrate dehydratase [Ectothiorhodospiraceae bacterium]